MATAALRRRNPNLLLSSFSTATASLSPPTPRTPNPFPALKAALRSESDADRLADLFRSSLSLPRFHSHRPLFSLAVSKLVRARRPDLVHALLSDSLAAPNAPKSEGFFANVIRLYASARLPDPAKSLFDRIPDATGAPATDKSLSALLSCYLQLKNYDLVLETFNSAKSQLGVEPGIVSCNVAMQALGSKGDMGGAREVFDRMCERGVVPDVVSFNTLLSGYLRSGDDEKFEEVLKEMLDRSVEVNVVTYNCRIARFCNKGQSFRGEELLDVMITKGMEPSAMTFQYLVCGYCKEGNVDRAVKVFHQMKVMKRSNRIDILPNPPTYCALVKGLVEKEKYDTAFGVCMEGFTRGVAPQLEVVKQLIEGLVRNSKNEEAKQVAEKVKSAIRGHAVDAWKKLESTITF